MCRGLGGENRSLNYSLPAAPLLRGRGLPQTDSACSVAVPALRPVATAPAQWDLPNPQGTKSSS